MFDFDTQKEFCAGNIQTGECLNCKGEMLTYHTEEQSELIQTELMSLNPSPGVEYDGVLIGAYRPCNHCSWMWTDETAMNKIPWAPWQPSGSEQGDNCVEMFVRGEGDDYRGKWMDQHCDNPGRAYTVCQVYTDKYPSIVEKDNWPASGGCPTGFIQFGKGCFKAYGGMADDDQPKPALEAQQKCKTHSPYAELAQLKIKQYEEFVVALMKGFGRNAWIGLHTPPATIGNYVEFNWADGSPLTSANWAPNQPNMANWEERQVRIYWTFEEDHHQPGQWSDENPDEAAAFICSAPRGSGVEQPKNDLCPTGWFSMFSACYKFIAEDNTADEHHAGCMSSWTGDR